MDATSPHPANTSPLAAIRFSDVGLTLGGQRIYEKITLSTGSASTTPRWCALRRYTIDNAIMMGVAAERGSHEVGKLADLAVLSQDILSVPAAAVRDTTALLTMLGGNIVHRAV